MWCFSRRKLAIEGSQRTRHLDLRVHKGCQTTSILCSHKYEAKIKAHNRKKENRANEVREYQRRCLQGDRGKQLQTGKSGGNDKVMMRQKEVEVSQLSAQSDLDSSVPWPPPEYINDPSIRLCHPPPSVFHFLAIQKADRVTCGECWFTHQDEYQVSASTSGNNQSRFAVSFHRVAC